MQRKLAAILAADVVGFARLMSEHEVGTLAALKAHRDELIEPKATEHHGRIVKLMGDGLLSEFGGGVDAVESPQIHDSQPDRLVDHSFRASLRSPGHENLDGTVDTPNLLWDNADGSHHMRC